MNKRNATIILTIFCIALSSFIIWRWAVIIPKDIATIQINDDEQQAEHPLDKILQANIDTIINKPQLAKQFSQPSTISQISNLWVDSCEVNQRDFGRFRQWSGLQQNPRQFHHPLQPNNHQLKSATAGHKLLGRLNMPVGGISLYEAHSYCLAAGGRLPTSKEFFAIAAGKKHRLYPWGNELNKEHMQRGWPFRDPALNVQQCKSSPNLATEQGVHDLGNNLLEWTLDGIEQGALMGGNAFSRPASLNALNLIRRSAPLDYRSQYSGFRCVYNRPSAMQNIQRKHPWGSVSDLIAIEGGHYPTGAPVSAAIPKMLIHLESKQFKQLKELPLSVEPISLEITQYEIQVKNYAKFLSDPLAKLGFFNHNQQPKDFQHRPINWDKQLPHPDRPVTNVNWWNAHAFAKWLGGRLITNREWRRIAGSKQTLYPWGNEYEIGRSLDRHHLNNKWRPSSVWLSNDANAQGVTGLAGNVAEWTSSVVHYGNEFHILVKGGSYYLPHQANQVVQTAAVSPNYYNSDLGFRVVFDKLH